MTMQRQSKPHAMKGHAMRIGFILGILLSAGTIPAADLEGINLGKFICGQRVSADEISGKVVIFEYWGINCPPCRANIPHISELAALADTDQLVVIANQCQEPGKTESVWNACGGNNRPCVIDQGGLQGASVSAIPRVFVFDHTGKQVFDGSPAAVDAAMVRKLMDEAPGPLVPAGDYATCRLEALALKGSDRPIAAVLKSLRTKAAKGKPEAQAEAQRLLDGVAAYADRMLSKITANRSSNPAVAWQYALRLQNLLKGDELAKPCEAIVTDMKSDKAFSNEIKAAEVLANIKAAAEKLRPGASGSPAARKDNREAVIRALDQVAVKYAGTVASAEASELRKKLASEM